MTAGYDLLLSSSGQHYYARSALHSVQARLRKAYVGTLHVLGIRDPLWYWNRYAFAVAAFTTIALTFFVLTIVYWDSIVPWINNMALSIREMGVYGYILMSLLVFIFCFPPLMGYGSLLYFNGFVFRFPGGFIPIFIGSTMGALCGFLLGRRYLRQYRDRWLAAYPNFEVIDKTVERGGLKLLVIIRLAPYPFGISNFLFSTTNLKLAPFMGATCLSLFRNLIHVYIGSTFASFAELKDKSSPSKYVPVILSFVLGIVALVYLTMKVRAVLNEERISDEQVGVLGSMAGPVEEELEVDSPASDQVRLVL